MAPGGVTFRAKLMWPVGGVSLDLDEDVGPVLVSQPPPFPLREVLADEPLLFRQFADLEPDSPSGVLSFATLSGRLWRSCRGLPPNQEPVAAWAPRVAWMRHLT